MKFELRNHPAQARHPITKEPLVKDGAPVPLFPDMRGIYLDGVLIGYCGDKADKPVSLIVSGSEALLADVKQFVTKSIGAPKSVSAPPERRAEDDE